MTLKPHSCRLGGTCNTTKIFTGMTNAIAIVETYIYVTEVSRQYPERLVVVSTPYANCSIMRRRDEVEPKGTKRTTTRDGVRRGGGEKGYIRYIN